MLENYCYAATCVTLGIICFENVQDWDKPQNIPDPDAKKPDDWDDEIDGEWEPPMIDNPDYKVGGHSCKQELLLSLVVQITFFFNPVILS